MVGKATKIKKRQGGKKTIDGDPIKIEPYNTGSGVILPPGTKF